MVVLSASICTRGGKPLLSRQFRDISKDRITLLLSNFPSLISNSSSQHTSVEDEQVRYVYQPLEEFYIVLITNKSSNILQDIDTLHLFASTISTMLRNIDEREIFDSSFEIIDAFDEIINLGYKENLTLSQVQTFMEMDSHEEKIQEIIERNKELEATEERKRRAKEIQRKELAKKNLEMQVPSSFGSSSLGNQSYQPTYQPSPVIETQEKQPITPQFSKPRGSGLQLGKKSNVKTGANEPLLANRQSTNAPIFQKHHQQQQQQQQNESYTRSKTSSPIPQQPKVTNEGILITIIEKVSARLSREGSVLSSEVKGDLQLRINDQELANCKILVKLNDSIDKKIFKTHPNVNKNLFQTSNIISVKDSNKSFPSNDTALGVLKWRSTGKQDELDLVPIIITAWVNIDDESIATVTLEYELNSTFVDSHPNENFKIENVSIVIPIISNDLNLQENDNVRYEIGEGIIFNIDSIDLQDPSGSFEFTIPIEQEEDLFPLELSFDFYNSELHETDVSLSGVAIVDVVSNNQEEDSLPFALHSNIVSDSYIIE